MSVVKDTVTYTGLLTDDPPKLTFVKCLKAGRRGRVFSEAVPVLEKGLLHRLETELTVGDEIELSVDYDYSQDGFPSQLVDFCVLIGQPRRLTAA